MMNRFTILSTVAASLLFASSSCSNAGKEGQAATEEPSGFVTIKDGSFYIDGEQYKYVGTNFWYGAILASEGRGGDRARLKAELDSLQAMGIDNLRILVGGDGPDGVPTRIEPTLQPQAGVYNDTILQGLDYLLADMERRGMKAVLYLNNAWEWSGGYGCYLEWAGKGAAPIPSRDGWDAYNNYVKHIVKTCKNIDPTRLYTAAFDLPRFDKSNNTYEMNDSVTDCLDFVSVNKYIGWYESWKVSPEDVYWDVRMDKPLVFSEFGGEALQGNQGDSIWVSSWTEEYQAKLYRDNLKMFENIQNLQGVFPWILFDFRSPLRLHSVNQDGWNRKGLVSERGMRKKAWYIVKEYYKTK